MLLSRDFQRSSNNVLANSNLTSTNVDITSFLNQEVARVHNITRTQALTPNDTPTTNQPQRVPLVITYNPALRYISSIINKHFNILSSSPRCTNVFKVKPFVAFRRSNNLSNILVLNFINRLPLLTHIAALSVVATTA